MCVFESVLLDASIPAFCCWEIVFKVSMKNTSGLEESGQNGSVRKHKIKRMAPKSKIEVTHVGDSIKPGNQGF